MRQMPFEMVSRHKALLYGMPHIGAHYERDDVNSHRLDDGALCAVCGRRATQAHHCPPKSTGRSVLMRTEWGQFVLKPALIALCAECHARVHRHEIEPRWIWNDDECLEEWAAGYLLSHGYPAHSPRLNELGRWFFARMGGPWMEDEDGA